MSSRNRNQTDIRLLFSIISCTTNISNTPSMEPPLVSPIRQESDLLRSEQNLQKVHSKGLDHQPLTT